MNQIPMDVVIQERRNKPRINCDYPAIVQGRDPRGKRFEEETRLKNLSASGLYLLIHHPVEHGDRLSVIVCLSSTPIEDTTPKIVASGIVVRTEPQPDGAFGVAVKFHRYRFV